MPEYKLKAAVPVDWLDDIEHRVPEAESLAAGTVLDVAPLVMSDVDARAAAAAKVRVNGREGIVRTERLRDALPDWSPPTSPGP